MAKKTSKMDGVPTFVYLEQYCNKVIEDLGNSKNLHFHSMGLTKLIEALSTVEFSSDSEDSVIQAFNRLQTDLIHLKKQLALITDN